MLHRELLIDGAFLGGECHQAIGKQLVCSPWDGHIVGTAAEAGWPEANAALDAAREAFTSGRAGPRSERQRLLRRIAALVREQADELADLLVQEVGKPIALARGEVGRTALTFDLAAELLDEPARIAMDPGYDPRGKDYEAGYERFPVGVLCAIAPYNWPFNLAAHKIAPALAAGNAVVLKGSPQASLCTLSLARLIHQAGCPDGALNAINCEAPVAERVALDPRVDMVSFTGSAAVGWTIKQKRWDKPVALELGGNASAIVCPGADLAWAAERLAASAFSYAGQVCISAQHVWAHESVYDYFKNLLIERTGSCVAGDPARVETVCGPMISDAAATRVEEWLEEAVDTGCRILAGGSRSGALVTPTLAEVPRIEDAAHPAWRARLLIDEVFGPVLTIGSYQDMADIVQHINRGQYGIHTSVFTQDEGEVQFAFDSLDVGGVVVNEFPTLRFDSMPYGGNKRSGFGREGVRFAFEEMTRPRTFVRRRARDGR